MVLHCAGYAAGQVVPVGGCEADGTEGHTAHSYVNLRLRPISSQHLHLWRARQAATHEIAEAYACDEGRVQDLSCQMQQHSTAADIYPTTSEVHASMRQYGTECALTWYLQSHAMLHCSVLLAEASSRGCRCGSSTSLLSRATVRLRLSRHTMDSTSALEGTSIRSRGRTGKPHCINTETYTSSDKACTHRRWAGHKPACVHRHARAAQQLCHATRQTPALLSQLIIIIMLQGPLQTQ
jgi:hypothetical protein